MSALSVLAAVPVQPDPALSTGETVLFWILAPLMVIGALGLLFTRKAVHAAVLMAFVMICLAVLYAAQQAPFLFAAQIVVYTGAVMMLFLFVLMLVGVDSADSMVETIKGQRVTGIVLAIALALLLIVTVSGITWRFNQIDLLVVNGQPTAAPREFDPSVTNPVGVAREVFGPYVFAFELVGTLLVIAALGALVLTHRQRLRPKTTQKELSKRRVKENTHVPPLPPPGVFARHNAVDTPALLPDGTPSELSVSRVLQARGQNLPPDVRATRYMLGEVAPHAPELPDPGRPADDQAADDQPTDTEAGSR